MPKTALELTAEERRRYRPLAAIRERRERAGAERQRRWQEARAVAKGAAELLREEYGATRVVIFGSLAHPDAFSPWSDIDLAVLGIAPDRFFKAVAAVTALSADFGVDLVDLRSCGAALREVIEREGVEV